MRTGKGWLYFLVVCLLLWVGCQKKTFKPVPIEKGDICLTCMMEIIDLDYAAECIMENGKVLKFDHPICMIQYFSGGRKPLKEKVLKYYVMAYDTKKWVLADSAIFVRGDYRTPVMDYNVTAFQDSTAARQFARQHHAKEFLNWEEMWAQYQEPDRFFRAQYSKNGLRPDAFECHVQDVVQFRITNRTKQPIVITIEGYPDFRLEIPGEESRTHRFKADRPGDRFDIREETSGKVVGRLVVSGAHLREETKEYYEY